MPNRLKSGTSAYLLQHANNPVAWYPWGEEAFAEAKRRNVPVLLSIGYSTCHWCHVMEEESFENKEIAKVMNENYVAIKVDREERPDLDAIYMKVVQAMTGAGGWPMTVWLTPEKKPFFAGTYFPPFDGVRGANVGFHRVLQILKERFDKEAERVAHTADEIVKYLHEQTQMAPAKDLPTAEVIDHAFGVFKADFDPQNGGTRGGPKFPSSLPLLFLLHYSQLRKNQDALAMVEKTLKQMALRGLYDHVGGGFHRYCVDAEWTIPHFEKMLYDNALLARVYLETFLATKNNFYRDVLTDLLFYLETQMRSPDGGFFAATDADSLNAGGKKEEGSFFVWSEKELRDLLGDEDFRNLARNFELDSPNFEGHFHLVRRDQAFSADWPRWRKVLAEARDKKPKPLRDEKIIVAWNALAISAFARAGVALQNPGWIDIAVGGANFIIKNLQTDVTLSRSYQGGKARGQGTLEDYAYFITALTDVFAATGNPSYLELAFTFNSTLESEFKDPQAGGYFQAAKSANDIILRDKPLYDGAEPSGTSLQFHNLLRFYGLTADEKYFKGAEEVLRLVSQRLKNYPHSLGYFLSPLIDFFNPSNEIIVVTREKNAHPLPATYQMGDSIYTVQPDKITALVQLGAEIFSGKQNMQNNYQIFICTRGVCNL